MSSLAGISSVTQSPVPTVADRAADDGRKLSEKILVSHYENNYVGAVKRLNAIGTQFAELDFAKAPNFVINGLKREELAGNRLQAAADELFDGDLAPLLTHLVRSQKLTAKDRENLRKLFDEMDGKDTAKGK